MQRNSMAAARLAAGIVTLALWAGAATGAPITVNSLDDDLFPDAAGNLFDAGNNPVTLSSAKCTLRMAVSSANLDIAVGGAAFGCAAGSGADTITFAPALNLATTPGTITLANKGMASAVAPGLVVFPPLLIVAPLTITGPGSSQLTLDGSVAAATGRRILVAIDNSTTTNFQFNLSGVRLLRGRVEDAIGGCLGATKDITLTDVVFESCESVSGPTSGAYGGALFVGNDSQGAGNIRPNVTIANSRFIGNRAIHGSSAIRSEAGAIALGGVPAPATDDFWVGAVSISNTVISGNSADTRGGLLIAEATAVTISATNISANAATGSAAANTSGRHGGLLIAGVTGNVTLNNGTRITGNVANETRGGFGLNGIGGSTTLDQVVVAGNFVNRGNVGGGEILSDPTCAGGPAGAVSITNSIFTGNSTAGPMGGLVVQCSGALTISDSQFTGNESRGYRLAPADPVFSGDAALRMDVLQAATLARVTIARNVTTGGAGSGAMSATNIGAFSADALRVVDNAATQGMAVHLGGFAAASNYLIVNSEIAGNSGSNIAALFIEGDGKYTLRNSTVSGNVAKPGGSIVKLNANTNTPNGIQFAIEHSTIARNTAAFEEAFAVGVFASQPNAGVVTPTLFDGSNAAISVTNSILGGRTPGFTGASAVGFDTAHGVANVAAANSLLEYSANAIAGFCAGTGMKCDIGALVSPLADNGGTAGVKTMALLAGSPAINAGGAVLGGLTTDARGTGFPRVIGGTVDMGSLEADPATTTGCTLDVDGNGARDALTDGLLIVRALIGMTGTAATTGALGSVPLRGDWTAIRNYLNANCGTSLAP